MTTSVDSRLIAHRILMDVYYGGAYSNLVLAQKLSTRIPRRDQDFIRQLVYGVLENDIYLNFIIKKLSKIRLKKIDPEITILLKLGLYQIKFLDRVPESAAVDESVRLAKKIKGAKVAGFVNAILRNYIRRVSELEDFSDLDEKNRISLKYSCPIWILDYWMEHFSMSEILSVLESRKLPASFVSIRVNLMKSTTEELVEVFKNSKMQVIRSDVLPHFLSVSYEGLITEHPSYKNGFFSIQDLSSGLAVEAMDVKENQKILDLCSAPGGKACGMAEKMNNQGEVLACDIHPHRLELIESNVKRLDLKNVRITHADALKTDAKLNSQFDAVLLDAPCSGFGTFRKKPEVFHHQTIEDVLQLADIQQRMLSNAASYVKAGGTLVYSTCTISWLENEQNVMLFLENNKDFELEPFLTFEKGTAQLLPNEHFQQGFFIAKFRKKVVGN